MVDESSRLAFQLSMGRLLVNRYSSGDRSTGASGTLAALARAKQVRGRLPPVETVAEFCGGRQGTSTWRRRRRYFRGDPDGVCTAGENPPRRGGPGAAEAAWCSNTEVPLAGLGTEIRLCKRPGGGWDPAFSL